MATLIGYDVKGKHKAWDCDYQTVCLGSARSRVATNTCSLEHLKLLAYIRSNRAPFTWQRIFIVHEVMQAGRIESLKLYPWLPRLLLSIILSNLYLLHEWSSREVLVLVLSTNRTFPSCIFRVNYVDYPTGMHIHRMYKFFPFYTFRYGYPGGEQEVARRTWINGVSYSPRDKGTSLFRWDLPRSSSGYFSINLEV